MLLIAALAIRARDFGNPVIHVDEQYYLLVGDRMVHGAIPYIDLWDRKPVGLFLIFAAIRELPGDGILAYQIVATLFAAVTAWVIAKGGRILGADRTGAVVAALAYILWLSFLSGRGGQSPVFYNLFMACAGVSTLHLPDRATRCDRRGIVASGAAACLLAGLAIQTKYTPLVEGAFFGIAHLCYFRRAGAGWPAMAGVALLWGTLGLLPTVLAIGYYHGLGPVAFDAFWFSNFASVTLRRGYPAAKICARLAGTTTQLSPFIACAVLAWRERSGGEKRWLAFGWLAAALIAFAMIGAFFDHYALPLMVPLTMIAAPVLGRSRRALVFLCIMGVVLSAFHLLTERDERASEFAVARTMAANDQGKCPYVFAGDAILYLLAHACVPTAYAFPSTLAYDPERGATGIDEAAEVSRILSRHPPVVVTMDQPLAPWNAASNAIVSARLARDYRLAMRTPRAGGNLLVYIRRGPAVAR
jgi:hypothetical protein